MFLSQAGAQPRMWEASPSEHKKWVEIEADSVMSSVEPNTSGIVLKEFLSIVRKKKEAQVYWNEIRHIFTAFDRHYRGYLTLEDFKKAFRQVAPKLPERIILEVFREVDQDSDDHVSFKDFEYAMNYGQKRGNLVCRYSPAGNRLQDRYFLPRALGKNTCKSEGKVRQKKKLKFKTVATEALAHPMGSSEGGMAFQRYLFFFFFLATLHHMEFPGQGSNPSCTMAIPDPLTYSVRMGIEPASWCCRDTAHPIAPQQELYQRCL
ncbi:EF-hand calcium-binding domain-containing protein 11 isoform X2 [Sus scrofa]|uniref:EF-hand calcium-binding domain-containing protein 11 isoform X2 n=1 Tax=Sus scrofa TaxID=9823 RepID=UPI000A2B85A9|nr:EF-hand calcium-binding domain-containing protein 11 isoform X2 [Sus scrofa]